MAWLICALISVVSVGCGDGEGAAGGAGGQAGSSGSGGAALLTEYAFADQDLVPESLAFDPTTRAFYASSYTDGTVTQTLADGTEAVVYTSPAEVPQRTLGVTIDVGRRRLFVCATSAPPLGTTPEPNAYKVWLISLDTFARDNVIELPALSGEEAQCNDLAVGPNGDVYVSDSVNPNVYRIDVTTLESSIFATDPLLNDELSFGGLNGIAVTTDGANILNTKTLGSSLPRLTRISIADPSMVSGVTLSGDDIGDELYLDGMVAADATTAYVASQMSLKQLVTTDDWASATVTEIPVPDDGLTSVVIAESRVFALYGDIQDAIFMVPVTPPFRIFEVLP